MTVLEILLPLVAVVLLTLPLIKVFTGKVSAQSAKRRLGVHISGFAGAVVLCLLVAMSNSSVFAAGEVATITGTIAQGLGFLAASLSTGFSALGAGIAVAAAAPAAIGPAGRGRGAGPLRLVRDGPHARLCHPPRQR